MNRILAGLSVLVMLWGTAAQADMIETKKDGIMNGKILSEDTNEVKFKDAKGRDRVFMKKDVLFLEKEDAAKATKQNASRVLAVIKEAPENIKKKYAKFTKKYIDPLSQPLDRSAADAKAAALNKTLEEAGRAAASGTGKIMTFNKEVYRQQNEAKENADGALTLTKKGHFSSLND